MMVTDLPCTLEDERLWEEAKKDQDKLNNELSSKKMAIRGILHLLTEIRSQVDRLALQVDVLKEIYDAVRADAEDHSRFLRSMDVNVSINVHDDLMKWRADGRECRILKIGRRVCKPSRFLVYYSTKSHWPSRSS
jgi:hypothetical protein